MYVGVRGLSTQGGVGGRWGCTALSGLAATGPAHGLVMLMPAYSSWASRGLWVMPYSPGTPRASGCLLMLRDSWLYQCWQRAAYAESQHKQPIFTAEGRNCDDVQMPCGALEPCEHPQCRGFCLGNNLSSAMGTAWGQAMRAWLWATKPTLSLEM